MTSPAKVETISMTGEMLLPNIVPAFQARSIHELISRSHPEKAATLLKVLEDIKDTKPTFDKTETKATYTLTQTIGNKKTITFKKVEKYWYIQN